MIWYYLILLVLGIHALWRAAQINTKASRVSDPNESAALLRLAARSRRLGGFLLAVWLITLLAGLIFVLTL